MKKSVRVSLEIPMALHRQLEQHAAATGISVGDLLLKGVEQLVFQARANRSKRVKFPLFGSDGPTIDLTNEQIYKLIDFP